VAEILVLLSPEAKPTAVKIIEDSNDRARGGSGGEAECRWELKDCIAVQKLLETSLHDEGAASSKLIMSLIHNSCMLNSIMKVLHWQCTRLGHHLPSFPIAWHLMFVLAPESCS
jgi:hypothetical protein